MNHDEEEPSTQVRAGAAAGLALFATDWAAAGVHRTPLAVAACSLFAFLVAGVLAGVAAGALPRGRFVRASGLAFGGAVLLHALSLVSKEVTGPTRTAGYVVAILVALGLAWLTGRVLERGPGRCARLLLTAAAIPAASLAWWASPATAGWAIGSSALVLVPAGFLALVSLPGRIESGLALAALVLLALPVTLTDHEPPRRFVPPPARAVPPEGAPSVVLVLVDTLRADHVTDEPERYGTHTMHALAQSGVRFRQAVTSAAWTLPATSSILTSLYPSQHGAVMASTALSGEVTTLAEVFQRAGYETAAFTGGAFVSPAFGLDQGFEYFDHLAEFRFRPFRVHVPLFWRVAKNRHLPLRPLLAFVSEFGGMPAVREKVEDWLAVRDDSRPFLLLVHTYQVHDYYIYHARPDDELRAGGEQLSPAFAGRLSVHPSELYGASQEDLDWFLAIYRERLRLVDAELGRLFASLRAHAGGSGDGSDLVIALSSDHGEGFDAARHRVHHGERLHDDLLRVPMILSAPGRVPAGVTLDQQVRTVDLMPTLIDLAGLSAPEGLAGSSLVGCLEGRTPWPPLAFGEERSEQARRRALRTTAWKLIQGTDGEEVYDLAADPLESTPVPGVELGVEPGDEPQRVPAELLRSLAGFTERYPERALESTILDEATLEHLRDLGYVE